MNRDSKEDVAPALTRGPIGRHLLRLTLPMAAGLLAMMGFHMVDTLFVGQLGTLPLAAMAMTFPMVMVMFSVSLGLGVSTSIAVSRAIGAGQTAQGRRLSTDAMTLGLCLVIVLGGLAYLLLDPVLHMLEGNLPTHGDARAYMSIWLFGLPAVILTIVGNMAIRATGDTLTPGVLMMVSVAINAVLDPLFIFGLGPFPRMEIAGAATATVIARGLALVVVLWALAVRKRMLASPFVSPRIILGSWRLLLKNAVPITLNNVITPLQVGAFTRLCATLGAGAVAGLGVANRVEAVGLTAVFALQSVVGVFVGQNAGAGKWRRVRGCMRRCEWFALVYGTAIFLVLLTAGRSLTTLFNPSPAVVSSAGWYYLIVGLTFGMRGIHLVGSAGLNALNRAGEATVLTSLHGLVIAVPAAWVGSRVWGLPGLFGGIAAGNAIGGIVTALWLRRRLRCEATVNEA